VDGNLFAAPLIVTNIPNGQEAPAPEFKGAHILPVHCLQSTQLKNAAQSTLPTVEQIQPGFPA
jgi:hypothetical protein